MKYLKTIISIVVIAFLVVAAHFWQWHFKDYTTPWMMLPAVIVSFLIMMRWSDKTMVGIMLGYAITIAVIALTAIIATPTDSVLIGNKSGSINIAHHQDTDIAIYHPKPNIHLITHTHGNINQQMVLLENQQLIDINIDYQWLNGFLVSNFYAGKQIDYRSMVNANTIISAVLVQIADNDHTVENLNIDTSAVCAAMMAGTPIPTCPKLTITVNTAQ